MADIPKAQRTPPEFITRSELLAIVRAANPNKTDPERWGEAVDAIEDRKLPVRWKDPRLPRLSSPVTTAADEPPTCRDYWLDVKIDPTNPDAVLTPRPYDPSLVDPRTAARLDRARRYRIPLFFRSAALRRWPRPEGVGESVASAASGAKPQRSQIDDVPNRAGDVRHEREAPPAAPDAGSTPSPGSSFAESPRRRAVYRAALIEWLAPQSLASLLRRDSGAIAKSFRDYLESERPELLRTLPRRLRSLEPEIDRHIKRRRRLVPPKAPTRANSGP